MTQKKKQKKNKIDHNKEQSKKGEKERYPYNTKGRELVHAPP